MSENILIRLPRVTNIVGAARSTIWLWVKEGKFPKPIKLSPRVTVWKLSEVEEWIESKCELSKDDQIEGGV